MNGPLPKYRSHQRSISTSNRFNAFVLFGITKLFLIMPIFQLVVNPESAERLAPEEELTKFGESERSRPNCLNRGPIPEVLYLITRLSFANSDAFGDSN